MRKILIGLCLLLCACRDTPKLQGQEFRTVQNGLEITLGFDAHTNRYYGKAINSYYGTYQIQGETISFSAPASTMYFADTEDLNTEGAYLDTLPRIQNYQLGKNTLTLISSNHQEIVFQKHTGP